jgi:hypothetical protein
MFKLFVCFFVIFVAHILYILCKFLNDIYAILFIFLFYTKSIYKTIMSPKSSHNTKLNLYVLLGAYSYGL